MQIACPKPGAPCVLGMAESVAALFRHTVYFASPSLTLVLRIFEAASEVRPL